MSHACTQIKMDQHGMLPDHLEETLQKANEAARMAGIKPPRVMFTVPSGQVGREVAG